MNKKDNPSDQFFFNGNLLFHYDTIVHQATEENQTSNRPKVQRKALDRFQTT